MFGKYNAFVLSKRQEANHKLGSLLSYHRKRKGLTQKGLAERLGICPRTVANIETEPLKAQVGDLLGYSAKVEVPIEDFENNLEAVMRLLK